MLRIDPASRVPPYEQLRLQILDDIHHGVLVPGTRLPPVRRLADELGLSANTVARTYRELEAAGQVVTAGRHGTRVAPEQPSDEPHACEAVRLTRAYLAAMRALGLDAAAIHAYLNRALTVGSE